ncbi:hypothetical protein [Streptomyces sp. NPDC001985]|uniref:hypothetical protein n=1 Tax=Streptomyces sp. NPDC001985 TaxID=3154406 RepID=UPI003326AF2E
MTALDHLLARALLRDDPYVQSDLIPHQDISLALDTPCWHPPGTHSRHRTSHTAARDLRTLCETLITHTAASLQDFLTDRMPGPRGARVLGCILQLAGDDAGARFWWQYAAGAGDDTAAYCLHLHHLALGETHAAAWWSEQTRLDTETAPQTADFPWLPELTRDLDTSTPTVLRLLGQLLRRTGRCRTEIIEAVVEYITDSSAVAYNDNPDIEMPLPGPDFADHITILFAATTTPGTRTTQDRRADPHPRLSRREPEHALALLRSEEPVRGGHHR